jgi:hypothetical protein
MSRESEILAVVTVDPTSTSDLYDRMGYPALVRLGLVNYDAFRRELEKLAASGRVARATGEDGATEWWLELAPADG